MRAKLFPCSSADTDSNFKDSQRKKYRSLNLSLRYPRCCLPACSSRFHLHNVVSVLLKYSARVILSFLRRRLAVALGCSAAFVLPSFCSPTCCTKLKQCRMRGGKVLTSSLADARSDVASRHFNDPACGTNKASFLCFLWNEEQEGNGPIYLRRQGL